MNAIDEYRDSETFEQATRFYNASVMLMDDELREEIHDDLAPCTEEAFLAEYCKRHEAKFGEDFVIS